MCVRRAHQENSSDHPGSYRHTAQADRVVYTVQSDPRLGEAGAVAMCAHTHARPPSPPPEPPPYSCEEEDNFKNEQSQF